MVTEIRFENMIRFAFNFNRHMGIRIEEVDSSYILEKWHSYFGDAVPPEPTQSFVSEWKKSEWSGRWRNFDSVAGHINIMVKLNACMLTPVNILEAFDGTLWGDPANDLVYEGLHMKIRTYIDGWAETHDEELRTVLREIRINETLGDIK